MTSSWRYCAKCLCTQAAMCISRAHSVYTYTQLWLLLLLLISLSHSVLILVCRVCRKHNDAQQSHSIRGHPRMLQQLYEPEWSCTKPATVTPWNRLPASVVTASSLDVFKGRVLDRHRHQHVALHCSRNIILWCTVTFCAFMYQFQVTW